MPASLHYTARTVQSESILAQKPQEPDLRVRYGQDPNQFADVRVPVGKGPYPLILFIHGGYWRAKYGLTYAGHFCDAMKKTGIATFNVEYRRVGNAGGGWPGTFEDIRAAYRYLMNYKGDKTKSLNLNKICVAGHSAGGQLALCLAAFEKKVGTVVSLGGVLDLRRGYELNLSNGAVAEFLGGPPEKVPEHYREASPIELTIAARQKIIHGTADDSVPYELSKNYFDRKKAAGETVELVTLPNAGHFEIVDPGSAEWRKIERGLVAMMSR